MTIGQIIIGPYNDQNGPPEHLPPGGPDEKTTINRLLEILDGQRGLSITGHQSSSDPVVTVGLVDDWRVLAVRDNGERVPVRRIFSGNSGKMTETFDLTQATHVEVDAGVISLDDVALIVIEAIF